MGSVGKVGWIHEICGKAGWKWTWDLWGRSGGYMRSVGRPGGNGHGICGEGRVDT